MNTSHDGDPAAEPDPTGMRELLASLPDPGPMPPEVSQRITASLRQEQQRRSWRVDQPQQEGTHRSSRAGSVTPLASRRSRAPHLLAAAAAVAAVAVAGTVVAGQLGDGTMVGEMASLDWDGGGGDDSAGGAGEESSGSGSQASSLEAEDSDGEAAGESAPEGDGAALDSLPGGGEDSAAATVAPLVGEVLLIVVTEPLTSSTFAVGASSAVEQSRASSAPADSGLTPQTARPCLAATGAAADQEVWVVGEIALDGEPAVLVVADGEQTQGWAVAPDCVLGNAAAQILLGPVELP